MSAEHEYALDSFKGNACSGLDAHDFVDAHEGKPLHDRNALKTGDGLFEDLKAAGARLLVGRQKHLVAYPGPVVLADHNRKVRIGKGLDIRFGCGVLHVTKCPKVGFNAVFDEGVIYIPHS